MFVQLGLIKNKSIKAAIKSSNAGSNQKVVGVNCKKKSFTSTKLKKKKSLLKVISVL